jgi:hypothetical protein
MSFLDRIKFGHVSIKFGLFFNPFETGTARRPDPPVSKLPLSPPLADRQGPPHGLAHLPAPSLPSPNSPMRDLAPLPLGCHPRPTAACRSCCQTTRRPCPDTPGPHSVSHSWL